MSTIVEQAVPAGTWQADPSTDPYGNERLGYTLETVVDRTEFGVNWNAELPGGGLVVGNEVRLSAELELIKEA